MIKKWFDKITGKQQAEQQIDILKMKTQIATLEHLISKFLEDNQKHHDEFTSSLMALRESFNTFKDGTYEQQQKLFRSVDSLYEEIDLVKSDYQQRFELLKPEQVIVRESELAKDSPEPWASITFMEFDPVRGFKFEGDWNEAFINNLKNSGFTGKNDEEIFQKYMARVALSISEKFELAQEAMNDAKGVQSRFE